MSVLYIDTSYDITLGLLDENLGWQDLRNFRGQKVSHTIQTETHRLLADYKTSLSKLTAVVSNAGPGFYTGLRFSEGFADVLSFFQIPHYSFYSYELPYWLGHPKGNWLTKAYRGEYFSYVWDGAVSSKRLLSVKELQDLKPDLPFFIHAETALDDQLKALITDRAISTSEMLQGHSQKIFGKVLAEKLQRESYYFRAPEDEFRTNP